MLARPRLAIALSLIVVLLGGALLAALRISRPTTAYALVDETTLLVLKGTVEVLTPDGKTVREISLKAKEPTNLAFGGPDGKTVYVTQRQGGFIESFRADRPGREFCLQRTGGTDGTCK